MNERGLLEKAKVFEHLPVSKLLRLMWWEVFNKKRLLVFYNNLCKGKHALAAFNDTLKQQNETNKSI